MSRFPLLLAIVSTSALIAAMPAVAASTSAPTIVVRDDISPNALAPAGIVDGTPDINGIGEMVTEEPDNFIGLCTGTLINPRTVIFAAHCVNEQPASTYGAATGGKAISFGFKADNQPAWRQWLGQNGGIKYQTNTANALYNVEQVWYDPRSLAPGDGLNFLEGDVALATLDTPADDIPTWALLFSPLTAPTHAVVTGYGSRGTGSLGSNLGIDFRRRSAENMISLLGSLDDVDQILFGEPDGLPQSLYQADFDDPKYGTEGANIYDFNIFDGAALPREGLTAGGDSGGPLIADQAFAKSVVVAVLSGGSRYYRNQPFSSYGSTSFYQPLFLFWDQIVANNPYRYAASKSGNADWTDPGHWLQTMDPAYTIAGANGALINALPTTAAKGVSGDTVKFGVVCNEDCTSVAQAGSAGTPAAFIPGGPGSTNFVPNNVIGTPTVRAQYYDVTLAAPGKTTLASTIRIDKLTISGATTLDVKSAGALTVLGDFTQGIGWTNVDGLLKTGEGLVVAGLLTGSGVIDPTYLTLVAPAVLPGGLGSLGTLTVKGDVILSSKTTLSIELNGTGNDRLAVQGDAQNRGVAALGGTVLFTPVSGTKPRQGQKFDFVTAQGGISGTFGDAFSLLPGVLKADVSYSANAATATLKAGSLFDLLKGAFGVAREVLKFASALDALRDGSYTKLYDLYGNVDLMDAQALAATLHRLAPSTNAQAKALQQLQSAALVNTISDRLTDLGGPGGPRPGLALIGSPEALLALAADRPSTAIASRQGFLSLANAQAPRGFGTLPEGMSGFVASSYDYRQGTPLTGTSAGRYGGLRTWNVAMGLEKEIGSSATLGFAAGLTQGASGRRGLADQADSQTRQMALYGAARLGRGFYVAGLGALARTTGDTTRLLDGGGLAYRLNGSNATTSLDMNVEGGMNLAIGRALLLTPRVALRHAEGRIAGYAEAGGDAALAIDAQRYSRSEGRVGLKLAGSTVVARGWRFEPRMQADWVRNLSGNEAGLVARFAAARDVAIALPGAERDGSWGELRGGFRLANGPVSLGADRRLELRATGAARESGAGGLQLPVLNRRFTPSQRRLGSRGTGHPPGLRDPSLHSGDDDHVRCYRPMRAASQRAAASGVALATSRSTIKFASRIVVTGIAPTSGRSAARKRASRARGPLASSSAS